MKGELIQSATDLSDFLTSSTRRSWCWTTPRPELFLVHKAGGDCLSKHHFSGAIC